MDPQPEHPTVAVPVPLYNLMAHCFYGGGPRYMEDEDTYQEDPNADPTQVDPVASEEVPEELPDLEGGISVNPVTWGDD